MEGNVATLIISISTAKMKNDPAVLLYIRCIYVY